MHRDFWTERWRQGQIGFHLPHPNAALVDFAQHLGPAPARILVPLCGKSHDMTWLGQRGYDVFGIEFVAQAADDYFEELKVSPQAFRVGGLPGKTHGPVSVAVGDFFAFGPDVVGPINGIYDRAALVALEPSRRADYARHLASLTAPGARLLLVNFVHDMPGGPPFSVLDDEVNALFKDSFAVEKRQDLDILGAESPFRQRGATFMREQVWLGTRRTTEAT